MGFLHRVKGQRRIPALSFHKTTDRFIDETCFGEVFAIDERWVLPHGQSDRQTDALGRRKIDMQFSAVDSRHHIPNHSPGRGL